MAEIEIHRKWLPFVPEARGVWVDVCDTCGVLVMDQALHRQSHEED